MKIVKIAFVIIVIPLAVVAGIWLANYCLNQFRK
jgi:ABC-type phosphate transport system permease subunit